MNKIDSLTIIFPVYNEEKRLKKLFKSIKFFEKKYFKLFVIFVDDGSKDKSQIKIKEFIKSEKNKRFKLIINKYNKGKGFSLKRGIKLTKTNWILTSDVDLSVEIKQVLIWFNKKYIDRNINIYWGSRSHKLSKLKTSLLRVYLGHIFKFLLRLLFDINNNDTQCGFKLYNKNIKNLFSHLKLRGFSHDVEIFLICKKLKHNIKFLPVKWEHKKNSKVNLFSLIKMFFELINLKLRYF